MIFPISIQDFDVLVEIGQIILLDFASQPGDTSRGNDQSIDRAVFLYLFVKEKKTTCYFKFLRRKITLLYLNTLAKFFFNMFKM